MTLRALIGAGFILGTLALAFALLTEVPGAATLARRLSDHALARMELLDIRYEPGSTPDLQIGDPVYSIEDQAFALQGRVSGIQTESGGATLVTVRIVPGLRRRLRVDAGAVAMKPENDLGWILRTLVPPGLREETLAELRALWEDRRGETLLRLKPHLLMLLGDVANVLVDSLPAALQRHRADREGFLEVFRSEIYPQELEPALRAEVLTRLEVSLGAIGSEIGVEIWENVSWRDIAGVLWTATKESFRSNNDEMVQRVGDILQRCALPVLARRGPEAVKAAMAAVSEAFDQPSVQNAIERAAWRTLEHPAFQQFMGGLLDDWLLNNPALAVRFDEAVRSRAIRGPIEDLYKAAEPLLEQSLEEMLTRPDRQGMDHQLVRVLRRIVLKKDKRYVLFVEGEGRELPAGASVPGMIGEDL